MATQSEINASLGLPPGINPDGSWNAQDYMARSVPGKPDTQAQVDAARAANPYSAQNMAKVDITRPGAYVQDEGGSYVALTPGVAGFDITNPTALQSLGELRSRGGTDSASQAFNAIATPAQKAEADRLWSIEKARLDSIDRQAGLLTPTGQTTQTAQTQATKTYTPAQTALYNAFRSGDIGAVNNAIQSGKLTAAQIKSDFGLTDADMSYLASSSGVKFYGQTNLPQNELDWAAKQKQNELDWAAKQRQNELDWAAKQKQNEIDWAKQQATGGTGLGGTGLGGSFSQNFQNYTSIPIGAQYNPNVVGGTGSPYSQIMGQMRPFSNPYAGMAVNQPLGGYNPGLYDQLLTSNVAKTAPDLVNTTAQQDAQNQLGLEQSSTGGMAKGGYVHGGLMFGGNPPGPDDGAVNLDMGEYVIKKSSVNKYGRGLLDMINEGKVPAKKMKSLLG